MRATVKAIADELTEHGLVLRYKVDETDDGLQRRGGDVPDLLLLAGLGALGDRRARAGPRALRAAALARRLARPLSPRSSSRQRAPLGNFPQAFTHLALINAVSHVIADEQPASATSRPRSSPRCAASGPRGSAAMTSFRDLGLSEALLQTLDELGYDEPTAIQEQAIPELLAGHDVIGQAQTGTGKTAAFGLPLLAVPRSGAPSETQALVLTPTRELCIQVTQALRAYAEHLPSRSSRCSAARPSRPSSRGCGEGAHVVVATVGRTMDLISRGSLVLDLGPLRRPRRGRRDARPRLHRGRRADPADVPVGPPDVAVLGDDPAADRAARRGATCTTR